MAQAAKKKIEKVRLVDYKPPVYLVDSVDLDFDIQDKKVRVTAKLALRRNPESKENDKGLWLDGEAQKLIGLWSDGAKLAPKAYRVTDKGIEIPSFPDKAVLTIISENEPDKNLALSGLYRAGKLLCTQCESEGFRRMTYFPDRPDVSSIFTVTIHADKKRYPFLLSNGNRIREGREKGGRHFAVWNDPFKKPCYLFALVAGDMDRVTSRFVTKSGRKVAIEVYTDPGRKNEAAFTVQAIPKAMRWDEKTYGLEYDLDLFMLVSVSAFNYGAMENKGLNIFNDSCALGLAETTTDDRIAYIERVVGHEYFHNYTGDRVTCRDWFQLSLKEGLTVFREQEFCADMNSRALERIASVADLRTRQFAEDAGAMAHAVRPAAYTAIDNFYTMTIYKKGSEVVRMLQTMVGEKGFRKGLRRYLKIHDGSCATCEDFVNAMGEANGIDLSPFMLWYEQAGTPVVKIRTAYHAKEQEFTLRIEQTIPPTPGQKKKKPMPMPIAIGLLDQNGRDCVDTLVLDLREQAETFIIKGVKKKPVPSLLRGFSCPVRIDYPAMDDELLFLMAHDSDSFNRWESAQKLYTKYILAGRKLPAALIGALDEILRNTKLDDGLKAAMLTLPSEEELALHLRTEGKAIDPVAVYKASKAVALQIAAGAESALRSVFTKMDRKLDPKKTDGKARGQRRLKNLCLSMLCLLEQEKDLAVAEAYALRAKSMTDRQAGLSILLCADEKRAEKALAVFEAKFGDKPGSMDSWFSLQSGARRESAVAVTERLLKHPAFTMKNPNRLMGLMGAFLANPYGFLAADGSGILLVTALLPTIDKINPHSSTRLLKALMMWKDYEPRRRAIMKACLVRLSKEKGLSPNSKEMIFSAL